MADDVAVVVSDRSLARWPAARRYLARWTAAVAAAVVVVVVDDLQRPG